MAGFTEEIKGGGQRFAAQEGVVSGLAKGLAGATDVLRMGIKSASDARKAEQEAADRGALSDFARQAGELERQESLAVDELQQIQNEIMDYSGEDKAVLADMHKKYRRLSQAQASGRDPNSIKAKKRLLLTQMLSSNPHLREDIKGIANTIDGVVDVGEYTGKESPIGAIQQEMLKQAAMGVPVGVQMEAAQLKARNDIDKMKLESKKMAGEVAYGDYFQDASNSAQDVAVQLYSSLKELEQTQGFSGVNGDQLKVKMYTDLNLFVNTRMQEIQADAKANGIIMTPEQLNNIRNALEGSTRSVMDSYAESLDSPNWQQDLANTLKAQTEIVEQRGVQKFLKENPEFAGFSEIFGSQGRLEIYSNTIKYEQKLLQGQKGDIAKLRANDPMFATAADIVENRGIISYQRQSLENPEASTGNPVLDKMIGGANVDSLLNKSLNQEGKTAALTHVFYGDSSSSVAQLLSDKGVALFRGDQESQIALTNFSVKDSKGMMDRLDLDLWEEGIEIKFNPVAPSRTPQGGSRYSPAEAFTIESNGVVPASMIKLRNKLNTLYTLQGTYRSREEIEQWASNFVEYSNKVKRDKLIDKKDRLIATLERRKQVRNPYWSEEDYQKYHAKIDSDIKRANELYDSLLIEEVEQEDVQVSQQEEAMTEVKKPAILDLIGDKEAPLGYNQVYGRNREVPLTNMTVNEVLEFQKELLAEGSPSTAVGRYQFITKTLNDLKRTEGLTGEEKFTEELQDVLATALLKRRGYDKYKKGQMSKMEFANNLAKEWASLPVVSGENKGRSYYAGDGLNKALIDVESYLASLED